MATPTTNPQTDAEKKAARAQAEKERRQIVKAIDEAKLETTPGKLTPEQRARALNHPDGITGKALANYILEGKTLADQIKEGQAEQQAKKAEQRTRQNITRSQDPEAAELAKAAAALAPDVKSAFLPKDARCFLDDILDGKKVAALLERKVEVQVGEGDDAKTETQTVKITLKQLEAFGVGGEKDKEVRAHLAALGHGTRLWGRKLALMMLAQKKREK
ncbi:MAG TPA: hypothetical protein VF192_01045 [Longimicrobiales bacterium]